MSRTRNQFEASVIAFLAFTLLAGASAGAIGVAAVIKYASVHDALKVILPAFGLLFLLALLHLGLIFWSRSQSKGL